MKLTVENIADDFRRSDASVFAQISSTIITLYAKQNKTNYNKKYNVFKG